MKLRDTVIDFSIFLISLIISAVLALHSGAKNIYRIIIPFVSAIICTGIFRIILPYSSLPRKERKYRDMLCDNINTGAFTDDPAKKRYLQGTVKLYHNGKFRRALIRLDWLRLRGITESDRFAVYFWSGMCCYYMKLYSDAIDELTECFKIREDSVVASNLGLVHLKAYNYEKAEYYFKSALELNSESVHAMHGLATVLMYTERYEEALELCRSGLVIDTSFYQFFEVMALCYAALGNKEEAYKLQASLSSIDTYDAKKLLNTLDELFQEKK